MNRILATLLLVGGTWLLVTSRESSWYGPSEAVPERPAAREYESQAGSGADDILALAFERQQSDVQVRARGEVIKILSDDDQGSRHQRFLLRLGSGQTLLVAHNIDLAPRIATLQVGDTVEFFGEYAWNDRGGVIHWTHRDPQGRHPHGWLEHAGKRYE